jgi:hypothetical protein
MHTPQDEEEIHQIREQLEKLMAEHKQKMEMILKIIVHTYRKWVVRRVSNIQQEKTSSPHQSKIVDHYIFTLNSIKLRNDNSLFL